MLFAITKRRARGLVLGLLSVLMLGACAHTEAPPTEPLRSNPAGVAIDGYSPVSYFTRGRAEQGVPEYAAEYEGVTYWFTDNEQLALFRADPAAYAPAHGGWCSLMMGGSGRRTPADPQSFAVVDGRLLLFWSGDTEQTRGMGMRNWHSKTEGDRHQEQRYLERAERQWRSFVAGERTAPIDLFKPRDAESVTAAQRAAAHVKYVE